MAEVFYFHVQEDRSIKYKLLEPIMQEDKDVAVWRFRIPKVLNNIDMSAWSWWFVYVNAKNQKFSELLTLGNDIDDPDNYCTADYPIGYGISKTPGGFTFALEAINAEQGGEIDGEWHTRTYPSTVTSTLQGNQAEYAETESDIISALMQEVRNKVNQLVGGATPLPVNLKSLMTDHDKVYLYTGSESGESTGYWYYYNGTQFVPGGQYGAGVQIDAVPTQGSNNAVSSGGVKSALDAVTAQIPAIDSTLSQSGQAADAKETGDEITGLKADLNQAIEDFAVPTQEAVDNWLDDHPEATTTVRNGSLTAQKIVNAVSPDNFTGTDSEKIASAINSLTDGGTVLLDRSYTLTSNVVLNRISSKGRITVKPISSNCIINCGEYGFTGTNIGNDGNICFDAVIFKGSGNLIDGLYLIRIYFSNCTFSQFKSLVVNGGTNTTKYIQSIHFIGCCIRNIGDYIVKLDDSENVNDFIYDVSFKNNLIEWCGGGVILANRYQGFVFAGNTLEGFTSGATIFKTLTEARGFVVRDNYFEKNLCTYIDLTTTHRGALNVDFSNNIIMEYTANALNFLVMPQINTTGEIKISNNTVFTGTNSGCNFVYVNDATTEDLSCVSIEGNSISSALLSIKYDANDRIKTTLSFARLNEQSEILSKINTVVNQAANNVQMVVVPVIGVALSSSILSIPVPLPFLCRSYIVDNITTVDFTNLGKITGNCNLYGTVRNGGFELRGTGLTLTNGTTYTGAVTVNIKFI